MKTSFLTPTFVLLMVLLFASCTVFYNGTMSNSAALSSGNFSYVKQNVKGIATNDGTEEQMNSSLVSRAKEQLLLKNPLKSNQALTNVTVDIHSTKFWIFKTRITCTINADIIEFQNENSTLKNDFQSDGKSSPLQTNANKNDRDTEAPVVNKKVANLITDYKTKTFGTQTWMTENLAYLPAVSPSAAGSKTAPFYYVYGYEGTDVSEAVGTSNYSTYGVLYNWEAAKIACPSGWHLPSIDEWNTLIEYLTKNGYGLNGKESNIGKSIAASSGWKNDPWKGSVGNEQPSNNRAEFNMLPGGNRNVPKGFLNISYLATFWSSSNSGSSIVFCQQLSADAKDLTKVEKFTNLGFSVRCVKD